MDIKPSIFAVLNQAGAVVGTGFLISADYGVTCSHVCVLAEAIDGDTVQVRFNGQTQKINAVIVPEYWRALDQGDVAILKLDSVPTGVTSLRLGPATDCRSGNPFYSFGYATAADVQGIIARGTIDGYLPQHNLLQLQAPQANHGISGSSVLDEKRGVVVGMITKGHTELGRNEQTTFATPTETIWKICPQLKPITSPLPRRNPIVEGINLLPYDYDQRIQNFLTEYLGTDAHPVPFGGRDEALHMLDGWLAETTPYLLLAAPAGRGKSALFVRWLDSLLVREDLALAFVPISIRFGTNMERVFYAALAARLAYLHGDDIPASPETSTAVYRGLVSDYLSKPLANGRTLLVVLDGLDEAADWQAGADFMPSELPTGVRMVVSARFLAGDADSIAWLRRLNWERSGLASAPSLTPLNRAGVADVLLKMGCPLDELSRKVDIVTELYRLSEGDPLLVGLYVGDLWVKGEEVIRLKPEELADIQPGYKGYFYRWWDDQKKLWGKDKPWLEKHVCVVRNLLAGALGALFLTDFHALDPDLESDYLVDALEILRRFIIGDNQIQGFTFSHPKLGQYFWEALSPTEQTQIERHFLAWGRQTLQEFIDGKRDPKKKDEVPFYVVRNYGAHLARAKQPIEKWLPIIHHQQWAQAWFTVEGAYGGYLQDVHRAWGMCKLLDRQTLAKDANVLYLGEQIRCGLIESSLHSLAENIPSELIWPLVRDGLWTLPQAWVFIHQKTYYTQEDVILTIIPHLNYQQLAQTILLVQAAPHEKYHASVLSLLAQRLPGSQLEQVIEAAQGIQDGVDRAKVLSVLAKRRPEMTEEALKAARTLEDTYARAETLITLAQHFPDVCGEALEAAQALENPYVRAEVLITLAQYFPDIFVEALKAARALENIYERARIFIMLTQHFPDVFEEALETTHEAVRTLEIEDQYLCDKILKNLILDLIPSLPDKQLPQMLSTVRALKKGRLHAIVLCSLAQQHPDVFGEALAAARALENTYERAEIFILLARHFPDVLEEALVTTRKLSAQTEWDSTGHPLHFITGARAKVLSDLAICFTEVFDEALETTRALEDGNVRAIVLCSLAQHFPDVFEEAFESVKSLDKASHRASMFCSLAQHYPGATGEALKEARALNSYEEGLTSLLNVLIDNLPEDQLIQVMNASQVIEDERKRNQVLCKLARHLPKNQLTEILKIARTINDEWERVKLTGELAQLISEVTDEELEIARALGYFSIRDSGCRRLIEYLRKKQKKVLITGKELWEKIMRISGSRTFQRLPETNDEKQDTFQKTSGFGIPRFPKSHFSSQPLSEEQLAQNLEFIKRTHSESSRNLYTSLLMQNLREIPIGDCYLLIEQHISANAQKPLSDMLLDIAILISVLIYIGEDGLNQDLLKAVFEVVQWLK